MTEKKTPVFDIKNYALNEFQKEHPRESLKSLLRRAEMQAERCDEPMAGYFIKLALDELEKNANKKL